MRFQKLLVLIPGVFCLVGFIVFSFERKGSLNSSFADSGVVADDDLLPVQVEWKTGEEQIYSFEVRSKVDLQNQSYASSLQEINVEVQGKLGLLVLDEGLRDLQILVRLTSVELNFKQGFKHSTDKDMRATIQGLERGIVVSLGRDGSILGFMDNIVIDAFADQLLRQAMSTIQVGLPSQLYKRAWQRPEIDSTGRYTASYHVVSADSQSYKLSKEKIGYSELASRQVSNQGSLPMTGTSRGQFLIQLDKTSGLPLSISGEEKQEVRVAKGNEITSHAQNHFSYKHKGMRLLSISSLDQVRKSASASTDRKMALQAKDNFLKEKAYDKFGIISLNQLIEDYRKVESVNEKDRNHYLQSLDEKLRAYVRIHGDQLDELRATFHGLKPEDPWLQAGLYAMAFVGCENCQMVLLEEVKSREKQPMFGYNLIHFLSQPEIPSVEIEKYLKTLTQSQDAPTSESSHLALGTVVYRLQNNETKRAEKIVGDYLDEFNKSSSMSEKLSILSVLGNAGSGRIGGLVKTLTNNPSSEVRAAAVDALRNVQSEQSKTILLESLDDSSERVRGTAVESLSDQKLSEKTVLVVLEHFTREKIPSIKMRMLRLISSSYKTIPEVKNLCEKLADDDSDADMQLIARNIKIMYADD